MKKLRGKKSHASIPLSEQFLGDFGRKGAQTVPDTASRTSEDECKW
jgi:hypothetical protein